MNLAVKGIYQIQHQGQCLLSDLTLGSCDIGDNRTWWMWDPDHHQLTSYRVAKFYTSKQVLTSDSTTGTLKVKTLSCDADDFTCQLETINGDEDKKFMLMTQYLLNIDKQTGPHGEILAYDISSGILKPSTDVSTLISLNPITSHNSVQSTIFYNACTADGVCGSPTKKFLPVTCNLDNSSSICITNPTQCQHNKRNCCLGLNTVNKLNWIKQGLSLTATLETKIIGKYTTRVTYNGDFSQFKNVIDFTKSLYVRQSGNESDPPVAVSGLNINSDGTGTFYVNEEVLGTTLFYIYGHYRNADLGQYQYYIDSSKCASNWCPFNTSACNDEISEYCSGIDEQGQPRLNTDQNCQDWGSSINYGQGFGDAAVKFCQTYSGHPTCQCMLYKNTPEYNTMKPLFNVVYGCTDCSTIPDPVCWAPPCTLHENSLKSSEQRNVTCQTNISICNQVLDLAHTRGTINISDNEFKTACGQSLPAGTTTPPSLPPTTPVISYPPSPTTPTTPSPPTPPPDTPRIILPKDNNDVKVNYCNYDPACKWFTQSLLPNSFGNCDKSKRCFSWTDPAVILIIIGILTLIIGLIVTLLKK
jgi:hypothetical protein